MREKQKLAPCPFCGSAEDLEVCEYGVICDSLSGQSYYVGCNNCNCAGPDGETKREAVKKWNKRVNDK